MVRILLNAYPPGRQGIALLALRLLLGVTLLVQGILCLFLPAMGAEAPGGIAALIGGAFLTAGFLTPIIGVPIALTSVALAFLQMPACKENLFETKLPVVFAAGVLLAIFLLGPGAFSIDAWLFGRRRIIIPPRPPV